MNLILSVDISWLFIKKMFTNFILYEILIFDFFFTLFVIYWFPERPHTITLQSPVNSDNNCFLDAFCQLSILPVLRSRSQTFIYFATPMSYENSDNNCLYLSALHTTSVVEPEPDIHILCEPALHLSILIINISLNGVFKFL